MAPVNRVLIKTKGGHGGPPLQYVLRLLIAHRYLALQGDGFLVVGVDGDGAEGVFARFTAVTAFEENSAQENVGVDQFWVPEDRCLQGCDCRFLIAASKIDATAEQILRLQRGNEVAR